MKKNELLVDAYAGKLVPRAALAVPAAADVASVTARVVPPAAAPSSWSSLLLEFPGVMQPFAVSSSPTHGVVHHITTAGPPVTAKFRRLDPQRLAAAKAEFGAMLKAGVVRRSSSCWSSPLHMVRKIGRAHV